jgi:hypothetical protein
LDLTAAYIDVELLYDLRWIIDVPARKPQVVIDQLLSRISL